MRKLTFIAILVLTLGINIFRNPLTDIEEVESVSMGYIESFYKGDTTKFTNSSEPTLFKYGYGFNKKKGQYYDGEQMTFDEAIAYATKVNEIKKFPKTDAPKKVEVLDVMNKIAAVKITTWWGIDYILLSKDDDKWMI